MLFEYGNIVIKCIILMFYIFNGFELSAQSPSYIHLSTKNGIPSNLVYFGLQDKEGKLWFGTDKGLVTFDNKRIRVFTTEEGLPDPEVLNIWEDNYENLWISCFRRKVCYRKGGKIITYKQDDILRKINLESGMCNFYEVDNKIWFTTSTQKGYRLCDHGI